MVDEFFLIKEVKLLTGALTYVPVLARGEVHRRGVLLEDGTIIPSNTNLAKFGDVVLGIYDEDLRELRQYPYQPPQADIACDPLLQASAEDRKARGKVGAAKLLAAVAEMRQAINEGRLTDELVQRWVTLRKDVVDATARASAGARPIYTVNFTQAKLFYTQLELRADAGSRALQRRGVIDSCAGVSVITPQDAAALHLTPLQPVLLEGFMDGVEEVPLMQVHVTLPGGYAGVEYAVASNRVREKTHADFLIGADVIDHAKKAGVSLL